MSEGTGFTKLRDVVQSFGFPFETCGVASCSVGEVVEQLHLPPEFLDYYVAAGPAAETVVPWVVEELHLASFDELLRMQIGYRWADLNGTAIPSWPTPLVVFGSVFDDPIMVDGSPTSSAVFFARHGEGGWNPTEIASSLAEVVSALTNFEQVLLGKYDLEVWDDNGLLDDFVNDVRDSLRQTLTVEQAAAFVEMMM